MAQKKKAAPTRSFEQLVADAQIKRLVPLVQQQVALAFQGATQAVYKFVMGEKANMMSRQLAFERLLKANTTWFNDEALAFAIATVEDESQGLVPSVDPVKVGDKVRAKLQVKNAAGEYDEAEKFAIHQVGVQGQNGALQTGDAIEAAVLGLTVGGSKEFEMPQDVGEGAPLNCRIEVVTVSCAPGVQGPTA